VACAPPALSPPEGEKTVKTPSNLTVDLPSRLTLKSKPAPELANPDGTLRISGVLARADEYLKREVSLRGYLLTAPKMPKERNTRAKSLVVTFSDNQAGEGALLTVKGVDHKMGKRLKVGQQYVVTGSLEQAMYGTQGVFSLTKVQTVKAFERAQKKAKR